MKKQIKPYTIDDTRKAGVERGEKLRIWQEWKEKARKQDKRNLHNRDNRICRKKAYFYRLKKGKLDGKCIDCNCKLPAKNYSLRCKNCYIKRKGKK